MSTSQGRRPRVAHVVAATDGAAWVVDMCDGLRSRGWDALAIVNVPEGPLVAALRRRGIPHVAVSQYLVVSRRFFNRPRILAHAVNVLHVAGTIARLAWILRRERIDVVHTHVFPTLVMARVAAWIARVPVRVAMIPGPYHLRAPIPRLVDRFTAWMDHRILAGSQAVDREYDALGHPRQRRSVVYYGPDASLFDPRHTPRAGLREELGLSTDTPLVGQIAYFYPTVDNFLAPPEVRGKDVKGHDTLVWAARLVLDRRPDVRFVFVGHGWGPAGEQLLDHTRELAERLGIGQAVHFLGRRQTVASILADLDVSVQPSRNDNLGGTIESLLMETPTVATAVGGMPESVLDENTGLLVAPEDPAALAAAVLRFLDDPEYAAALARAGRERMLSGFTLDHTVEAVDAAYRALGAGESGGGRAMEPAPRLT